MAPKAADLLSIWQSLPMELVLLVLDELVTIYLWNLDSDPFYPWEMDLEMRGEIPVSHLPDVQHDCDKDSIKMNATQLIGGVIRSWRKDIEACERQGVFRDQCPPLRQTSHREEYRRILFPRLFVVHHGGRHYHQKTRTVETIKGFPRWKDYIDQQAQKSQSISSANTNNDTVTFYIATDRGLDNRLARLGQQSHGPVWDSLAPYPASGNDMMPHVNLYLVLQYQSMIGVGLMGNTGVFVKTALQTTTNRLAVRFSVTQLIDA
ncbi:hypothetical protein B0T09DRAFT_364479 [Sordaria sp. MPI-SDFR-AT-0083]|nr:hypothetical protein B0T09DRAFT_364479 [Sordaria sp. MPI-SDFR-AT-0083]